jgi:hypothetical protein
VKHIGIAEVSRWVSWAKTAPVTFGCDTKNRRFRMELPTVIVPDRSLRAFPRTSEQHELAAFALVKDEHRFHVVNLHLR